MRSSKGKYNNLMKKYLLPQWQNFKMLDSIQKEKESSHVQEEV